MMPGGLRQRGAVLISVVIALTVLAALLLHFTTSTTMDTHAAGDAAEDVNLDYLIESAGAHVAHQLNSANCSNYQDLSPVSLGGGSYSGTISTNTGSPVDIALTGTLASGLVRNIDIQNQIVFAAPTTATVEPAADTDIDSTSPDTNSGSAATLRVGNNAGEERSLLKFDLEALPQSSRIESAVLSLTVASTSANAVTLNIRGITKNWVEKASGKGATWNKATPGASWNTAGGDMTNTYSRATFTSLSVGQTIDLDITDLVRAWADSALPDNGLVVVAADGPFDVEFASREAATAATRPSLAITYACECGTPCPQLGKKALAHWKLDDGAGVTAVDSVGDNDGELSGGPIWSSGQLDGALRFDGVNDEVRVPHANSLNLDVAFTITAWANASYLEPGGFKSIITKGDGTDHNFWFGTLDDEVVLDLQIDGAWYTYQSPDANLQLGTWYHLAATVDGDTGDVRLYVDGVQRRSATHTWGIAETPADVSIGASVYTGEQWDGLLDDVRIYDTVLSADDVQTLAKTGSDGGDPPDPPGSVGDAHWPFDEGSGSVAEDIINGNDGKVSGGASWSTGRLGDAITFDGVDGTVIVPDSGTLDYTDAMTMAAWVRVESGAFASAYRIVSKESTGYSDNYWMALSSGSLYVGIGGQIFVASSSFANATWYHVAASYDAAEARLQIVVNGVADSTHFVSAELVPNDAPLFIGSNWEGTKYFSGTVDDVRLYARALTLDEIASIRVDGGGGGTGACNGDFSDRFNSISFDGDDGTLPWSTLWLEIGESNGAAFGDISVLSDNGVLRLRTRDNDNGGEGVEREANTKGAGRVVLDYLYRRMNLDASSDYTSLQVSENGASGPWYELTRHQGPDNDVSAQSASFDISSFASSNMRIRYLTSSSMGNTDTVWIDDVRITCSD